MPNNYFLRDLGYLVNLTHHIDRMYSKNDVETHHYIKRMRKIILRFNEKYHLVNFALSRNYLKISLRVFIHKESVDQIFRELEDETRLKKAVFEGKGHEQTTIALKHDPNRLMVELIYRPGTLEEPGSPELKLLEYYATKSVDESIDIKEDCDGLFSFEYDPDEDKEGIMYTPGKHSDEGIY